MTKTDGLRVLGVRHHGPGSARAVRDALEAHDPDVVCIEGPPEADALVRWVADGLTPPVALLAYDVADPARSAFWPYAVFSPEWQALTWAVEHHREVRFCDLPAAVVLAPTPEEEPELPAETDDGDPEGAQDDGPETHVPEAAPAAEELRGDPIAVLARAAGYDDPERWWEDMVESRSNVDVFDAITEAMAEMRAVAPPVLSAAEQLREDRREAQMRQVMRAAIRDHDRVAVVCGAWHAPALSGKLPTVGTDSALLRRLPKANVSTAWVPWTHSRLSFASGYGAGIESPGWYAHLFAHPDLTIERWFTEVAGVLRAHDLPVSSAHAIEATRLAETLATLRGRPLAGLDEVQEAALAVMCDGSATALSFVTGDLVVGERLGSVPDGAPLVPLDADLRQQAKSARLVMSPAGKDLVLDLRKDLDRRKSQVLRRLLVLGIGWGTPGDVWGTGTFKEAWSLTWRPEFAVAIVAASSYGTTVASAAEAKLLDAPGPIADITARVEQALLCDLPRALPGLLSLLDRRAAEEADISHLMAALPALVRAQRYGDVRGTDTSSLAEVARAMLARVCAGLPAAASGLSPAGATQLKEHVDGVHAVVGLLGEDSQGLWLSALQSVLGRADVGGLLAGRLVRVLLDAGVLDSDDAANRLSQALSHGPTVADRAAFAEGFLSGSALLLVHDRRILALVDGWLTSLSEDDFTETLPVLRRAFGSFNVPERRAIADQAALLGREPATTPLVERLDLDGMDDILATVRMLLGRGQEVTS